MKAEDWIKVEDRLPEVDVDVLINYELDGIIRAYYDKEEGWMSSELGLLAEEYVTHWMPIVYPKKECNRTCRGCLHYENHCPFIAEQNKRGELGCYPNRVCGDYKNREEQ